METITPLHQGISVPDVEEAAAWYADVFGFELLRRERNDVLNAKIVFLRSGSFELELFEYLGDDARPLPPERRVPNEDIRTCVTKHVAYRVGDMDRMAAWLREKNVDIAIPPFSMNDDKACFIRDCAGTLIELIQTP